MRFGILLMGALAASVQMTNASGPWTNEPAGAKPFLDCPFNSIAECGLKDGYASAAITKDATAPVSPANVMQSRISAGANTGGVEVHYYMPQIVREIFVGLIWRTNPAFYGRQVENKMFFVRGPRSNGLFGLYGPPGGPFYIAFTHNASNLDNSHTCQLDLGLYCPPNLG